MSHITYQLPIVLSSSTSSGAKNKSSIGSSFSVILDRPILVPKTAKYCWVETQASEIWYTTPNILTGDNDKIYVTDGSGSYTITIPQGLYDVPSLNEAIERQTVANGRPANEIVCIADLARSLIILEIASIGVSLDFTQTDTVREILGFDSSVLGPTVATFEQFEGPNVSRFNQIDYFLIHSDLVNKGLLQNNRYTQTIGQVLIDVPPASQILSRPQNPPRIPAMELIGDKKNFINVWLTDQNNTRVDTAGEDFSVRVVINYVI